MDIQVKYIDKVNNLPAPGEGCHPALLGAANLGLMAGVAPDQVFYDIRRSIQAGKRKVSDDEIQDAISKAQLTVRPSNVVLPNGRTVRLYRPPIQEKPKPLISNGQATLRKLIEQSPISDEADLWEDSEYRLCSDPADDPVTFLQTRFEPQDLLFIGERKEPGILGQNIKPQANWIKHFESGGRTAPFIICNPLTGHPAKKKSGDGVTFRGDASIANFKYCICEFDTLNREEQIRFWSAVIARGLPVVALVDSGGKSIHAWIRVEGIKTLQDWDREVKGELYEKSMIPMGVDAACSNPARLSRLPGHARDNGNIQKILWLKGAEGGNNELS